VAALLRTCAMLGPAVTAAASSSSAATAPRRLDEVTNLNMNKNLTLPT
jgi:Na+/H+-dicarboxylate symporter